MSLFYLFLPALKPSPRNSVSEHRSSSDTLCLLGLSLRDGFRYRGIRNCSRILSSFAGFSSHFEYNSNCILIVSPIQSCLHLSHFGLRILLLCLSNALLKLTMCKSKFSIVNSIIHEQSQPISLFSLNNK